MGLFKKAINTAIIGSIVGEEVRSSIRTAKMDESVKHCVVCGTQKKKGDMKICYHKRGHRHQKMNSVPGYVGFGISFLCKDCSTKCKKCGNWFCKKHHEVHEC